MALKKVKELFNFPQAPDSAVVDVSDVDHPLIPKRDDYYLFVPEHVKLMLIWIHGAVGKNIYLAGHTGVGKSSVVEQFLNRLRVPRWRIGGHNRLEFQEMVGRLTIMPGNGGMGFVYGPLANAMKTGGVFLLDEADQLHPSTSMAFNTILDGGPLLIPQTGEVIEPHPQFRIAVTGNTAGGGDETGRYRGVQKQNVAFMRRFFAVLKVDYLNEATELNLLAAVAPTIQDSIRQVMVKFAGEVRKLFINQDLDVVLSTQDLLHWARLAKAMNVISDAQPMSQALELVFVNRANAEDAAKVKAIWQRLSGQ